jgi:ribosomal protein S18 acetylase RimI-like enzyme
LEIAPALPVDAEDLRELHVATWTATYRGQLPDAWFDQELAAHRVRDWGDVVRSQMACGGAVLAARRNGRLVGLCQYGPVADDDADAKPVGHIHRLYVDPAAQRSGAGRALLSSATDGLREMGLSVATLWVLETDGRARAFYEGLGWRPDGGRKSEPVTDLRYRLPLI